MDAAQFKTQGRFLNCYFRMNNNLGENHCLVVDKDKVEVSQYAKILEVTFDNSLSRNM